METWNGGPARKGAGPSLRGRARSELHPKGAMMAPCPGDRMGRGIRPRIRDAVGAFVHRPPDRTLRKGCSHGILRDGDPGRKERSRTPDLVATRGRMTGRCRAFAPEDLTRSGPGPGFKPPFGAVGRQDRSGAKGRPSGPRAHTDPWATGPPFSLSFLFLQLRLWRPHGWDAFLEPLDAVSHPLVWAEELTRW